MGGGEWCGGFDGLGAIWPHLLIQCFASLLLWDGEIVNLSRMPTMNQGERDELLVVLTMLHLSGQGKGFVGFAHVDSVRSRTTRYVLPNTFDNPKTWQALSDTNLLALAARAGIGKAGARDKADVIVNDVGISLKSFGKSPPAIVNHTTRPGWEAICQKAGAHIEDIDPLVDDYWTLRLKGSISEDVPNHVAHSPFRGAAKILAPVLGYFLLKGSPSGDSVSPADKVLDCGDSIDPATWRLHSADDVIPAIWDKLVFSVRAKKGMPSGYPARPTDLAKRASVSLWTREVRTQFYGALHVRVRK